jgi:predicted glycogen debranching enzyme
MISFDAAACRDLETSAAREWLETNGLGGFASSTVAGMNTRRYHGLLTAAVRPPTVRAVILSKLEEALVVGGERFELATNRYSPGVVHPQGYLLQTGFRLDPFPVFTYEAGGFELEKRVFMIDGENTTVVRYTLRGAGSGAALELRPLVAFRDYHSLVREALDIFLKAQIAPGLVSLRKSDDQLTLHLAHDAREVSLEGLWYRNFEYAVERDRGFDFNEDLFNPCLLTFDMAAGATRTVVASTEPRDAARADDYEAAERMRRAGISNIIPNFAPSDASVSADTREPDETRRAYLSSLAAAAEQFVVRRDNSLRSVIAGYLWFTDWGRDTMISLPGLALARERHDEAREILLAFAARLDQGMIPNRFPDGDEPPEYNTLDATLWFVNAVGEYARRTNDDAFVRESLFEPLREIVSWHERGTRHEIRMTPEALLRGGTLDTQLTWMDAKVGDYVVTPRAGLPVEIQALWYNALRTVEHLARGFSDDATANHCRSLADAARASFHGLFWNEVKGCLYDCVDDNTGEPDDSVRPNQIFAVSLPHPVVTGDRARSVVEVVRRELLTPFGLRSLSPRHPDYRPRYEGDAYARDTAYHQGTVWAWLIGPFVTAYLRVHGRTPETVEMARGWLAPFRAHLSEAGLGQISEIFDGDAPHTPRGCVAQAWSVAEVLRCELEELV